MDKESTEKEKHEGDPILEFLGSKDVSNLITLPWMFRAALWFYNYRWQMRIIAVIITLIVAVWSGWMKFK